MFFASGETRFVVFFPGFVVKIARVRVVHFLLRIMFHLRKGTKEQGVKTLKNFNNNPKRAVFILMFQGIRINWCERAFWKQKRSLYLLPTYFTFLGIFNIQKRGDVVDTDGLLWQTYLKRGMTISNRGNERDYLQPKNLSSLNGKLMSHDYGDDDTMSVLDAYAEFLFCENTA